MGEQKKWRSNPSPTLPWRSKNGQEKEAGHSPFEGPRRGTLKQIYQCAREQFTAADLQKFTEIEPMIPAEEVLAKLEDIHRKGTARWEKKKSTKKNEK